MMFVILFWNFECLDDDNIINVWFLCLMSFTLLYFVIR